MAEVLGPFGFCFGAISFIFSTIPTVAKAGRTYLECAEYFNSLETRASGLAARYSTWEITWKGFNLGIHDQVVSATRRDMKDLADDIEREMKEQKMTDVQRQRWKKTQQRLLRGVFQISAREEANKFPTRALWKKTYKTAWNTLYRGALRALPQEDANFHRSLGYAMWKKEIIERWLTRMNENIEAMERICDNELEKRTAGHLDASASKDRVQEVTRLETFIEQLSESAKELHRECTAVEPTYGWGLGLWCPSPLKDVINWDEVPKLDVELYFSGKWLGKVENFQLYVPYHKDEPKNTLVESTSKVPSSNMSQRTVQLLRVPQPPDTG